MEEVVAEWKPDALFSRPGKKVLHYFPPGRREKMPKDMRPVEKVTADQRVNRGQYREILKDLLGRYGGDVCLARAAALLDPLAPGAVSRVLGLLGKGRAYGEMSPFLDDMERALAERAKSDRSFAKKCARLKTDIARHRERVLERGRRAKEGSTEGR